MAPILWLSQRSASAISPEADALGPDDEKKWPVSLKPVPCDSLRPVLLVDRRTTSGVRGKDGDSPPPPSSRIVFSRNVV